MTLLCLGPGGYVAYEQQKARRQREAVETLQKLGGDIDFGSDETGFRRSPGMRWLLGDERFGAVQRVDLRTCPRITDADLSLLKLLPQLQTLDITDQRVTDAGIEQLAGLANLQRLSLDDAQVTDAGLMRLAGLTNLQRLWLDSPRVTERGIQKLQGALPNLRIIRPERGP